MECLRCNSKRIAQFSGQLQEGCHWATPAGEYQGIAVPLSVGLKMSGTRDISSPDWDTSYLHFQYCLDCGQIQDQFPIPRKAELRPFKEICRA